MVDGGVYSKGNEKLVLSMRDEAIRMFLLAGKHVIVDDTNLHPKHEEEIRAIVAKHNTAFSDNVVVEIKTFDTSVEECIARDLKRDASVGAEVILKMARQWCPDKYQDPVPELDMKEAKANGLPWCVIYDLDGTAAIMGDRSPYDASQCDKVDRCNHALSMVLDMMLYAVDKEAEYTYPPSFNTPWSQLKFIAMSGRDSKHREPTLRFLDKHAFPYDALYMRAEGDNRKDAIVKEEMYEQHIKGRYNVLVVFDDRNQVVDLWRKKLGIPCFQVNYGDF
jgi:predicted kinase